jgi:hypothetical protein
MEKSLKFEKLGFIGLGAMGRPMVTHLANKLPEGSRIWVYDVVEGVVDDICAEFPDRIVKGTSAKDVAEHTVGSFELPDACQTDDYRTPYSPWYLRALMYVRYILTRKTACVPRI